jgi:hypothetical protein
MKSISLTYVISSVEPGGREVAPHRHSLLSQHRTETSNVPRAASTKTVNFFFVWNALPERAFYFETIRISEVVPKLVLARPVPTQLRYLCSAFCDPGCFVLSTRSPERSMQYFQFGRQPDAVIEGARSTATAPGEFGKNTNDLLGVCILYCG